MTMTATKADPYRFFVYAKSDLWIQDAVSTPEAAEALRVRCVEKEPGKEWIVSEDWKAFEAEASARFMTGPEKIDSERWHDMLNIMPPLLWTNNGGLETFMICEATYGSIHTQFGRVGDRYAEKNVDRFNPATYLTAAEIEAVNA